MVPFYYIQLFRERLSEKMCTRQSRKVIWDMISTRFLTTVAVEPTFVAFLWHSQTQKKNKMQEKKEKKSVHKEAWENVYASLTYFWDLYNGNVRNEILIFLILFE